LKQFSRLSHIIGKSKTLLFILGGFFITNTLLAELVGTKIFSLESTFGFEPLNWTIFGTEDLGFNLTAGVLLWPVVFVLTDVINEYFGPGVIKWISYLTIGLVFYAFLMIFGTMFLAPNSWWDTQSGINPENPALSLESMSVAYNRVMGQGMKIILGSMIAFLIGQIIDAKVFHKIKKVTGEEKIWLRATGSTLISQFIDSYVVLLVAFWIGADWELTRVMAIGTMNYIYKFIVAIILTPVIYLAHHVIDSWLGERLSERMKRQAAEY
jgi:uncharacterized integral membrane protein (TIGR00697 family)